MAEEASQPSESTEEGNTSEATTVDNEGNAQSETTYLDGKYKSVSDLENGYKELQSAFSKKTAEYNENIKQYAQTQAPEEYELAEGVEVTPRIETLIDFGKEYNLSNEALNEIIARDKDISSKLQERYISEQKELLGKDADARLKNVKDWAIANNADEATFNSMMSSAKAVEFMEKVMKGSMGTTPTNAPSAPTIDKDTLRQMRFAKDEYGNRKMSSDPSYRAKVEALEQQLLAN